jgi:hypothetical protein
LQVLFRETEGAGKVCDIKAAAIGSFGASAHGRYGCKCLSGEFHHDRHMHQDRGVAVKRSRNLTVRCNANA